MNIIAWIVLILNGLTCCIQLKDMFTKNRYYLVAR